MKKKLYKTGIISIVLLFVIVSISCGTAQMGVYGSAIQEADQNQLCKLRVHYEMGITGINGKPVSWGISRQVKYTAIDIPAGPHSLRFEYYKENEYVRQQASNFTFSYEFLPGHNYEIRASMGGRTVLVTVSDKTNPSLSKSIPMRG